MSCVRLILVNAVITLNFILCITAPADPGDILWTSSFPDSVSASPVVGPDGTIYVASRDLHALSPSGASLWTYSPGHIFSCTPALRDDVLYSVCSDLYAINTDGTLAWSYALAEWAHNPAAITESGVIHFGGRDIYKVTAPGVLSGLINSNRRTNSPASLASDGTLYLSSYGAIVAIASDDSLKWSYDAGLRSETSPAIDSQGHIIVAVDSSLLRLTPDGMLDWQFTAPDLFNSSPSIGLDGTIYLGCDDGNLYAINSDDGSVRWTFTTGAQVKSSPAVGVSGSVYFGSNDGNIYAVDLNGSELWRVTTNGSVVSSPAIGPDGRIYVGSQDRKLYVIESASAGLADTPWPMYRRDTGHTAVSTVIPPVSINAKVSGVVTDTDNAPLAAWVIVSSPDVRIGAFADTDGSFTFNNLLPGNYTLTGFKSGYFPTRLDIELMAGQSSMFVLEMVPR